MRCLWPMRRQGSKHHAAAAALEPETTVLLAIFADIHANREAFSACLAQARRRGAERFILLGDLVGYGADPEWVVDTAIEMVGEGTLAVQGNHDRAIGSTQETMNADAQAAVEWTRGRLGVVERNFLAELPLTLTEDDRLYVHSDASNPASWRYVRNSGEAGRSMIATPMRLTFCGHTHRPELFSMASTGKIISFTPQTDVAIELLPGRQWLAVLGSVGQPRDGNPAASFAMFDTERRELTYCRAAYDVSAAAARIRENGLPVWLADRLALGT